MAEKPIRQRRSRRQIAALRFLSNISLDGSSLYEKPTMSCSNSTNSKMKVVSYQSSLYCPADNTNSSRTRCMTADPAKVKTSAAAERSKSMSLKPKECRYLEHGRRVSEASGNLASNFLKHFISNDRSQCVAISGVGLAATEVARKIPSQTRVLVLSSSKAPIAVFSTISYHKRPR